jgi:hypothetical protein
MNEVNEESIKQLKPRSFAIAQDDNKKQDDKNRMIIKQNDNK